VKLQILDKVTAPSAQDLLPPKDHPASRPRTPGLAGIFSFRHHLTAASHRSFELHGFEARRD
jgi:hypothetical protein